MPRVSQISKAPPYAVRQALERLGRNIKTARLRRRLSRSDLAEKIGITRFVMADIENGKATTAVAAYLGALWALDLLGPVSDLADPDLDAVGKTLESARAPSTAPKRRSELDDAF